MSEFVKGDRVMYSQLAIRRNIGYKDPARQATVIGRSSKQPDCIRVCWDGTKETSTVTIHESFLEKVDA